MKNLHITKSLKITIAILIFGILLSCQNENGEILQSNKELDATSNTFLNDKLDNTEHLNSLKELNELDIPIVTVTKGDFQLIRDNSWKITPQNLIDGNFSFIYFKGYQHKNSWYVQKYFSDLYPTHDGIDGLVIREIGNLHGDFGSLQDGGGGFLPPLVLEFAPRANTKYILSFSIENYHGSTNKMAVLINGRLFSYVKILNDQFVFPFEFNTNQTIRIGIGGLYLNRGFYHMKISEINVAEVR